MENPTVLVTGAAGFLGRHVVEKARAQGAEAVPLVRSQYDLCHEADAALAVLGARPTHIIHTAFHRGGPGPSFRTNMAIGMNVIHSAAVNRSRLTIPLMYYGALPWERESPVDVDACREAQRALEKMCEAYDRHYELDCALVRLPTLFGGNSPRPDPVSLIAMSVWKAAFNRAAECTLPFDPDDTFNLLYVGDAAEVLAAVAFSGAEGPCRIKTNTNVLVGDIIASAVKLVDFKGTVKTSGRAASKMAKAVEDDDVHEVFLERQTAVETGMVEVLKTMMDRDYPIPKVEDSAPPAVEPPSPPAGEPPVEPPKKTTKPRKSASRTRRPAAARGGA